MGEFATELVRLKVDVIVAPGVQAVRAAKQSTTTIPIIFPTAGDAVASGLVASLARPGGNITGLSQMTPEMAGNGWSCSRKLFPSSPA
jgi:putative ABC transport system substrate-binding protein